MPVATSLRIDMIYSNTVINLDCPYIVPPSWKGRLLLGCVRYPLASDWVNMRAHRIGNEMRRQTKRTTLSTRVQGTSKRAARCARTCNVVLRCLWWRKPLTSPRTSFDKGRSVCHALGPQAYCEPSKLLIDSVDAQLLCLGVNRSTGTVLETPLVRRGHVHPSLCV